jgi:hypothetical protein
LYSNETIIDQVMLIPKTEICWRKDLLIMK